MSTAAEALSRMNVTRAQLLRLAAGLSLGALLTPHARSQPKPTIEMNTRKIPSTGEALPVIGCGTWIGFDKQPGSAEYQRLSGVLEALFAAGGTVIDSSPMYGRSEETTGDLLAANPPAI